MIKLGAKELRTTQPKEEQINLITHNPIYLILEDVLDTYNVGAIFRLADAVSAERVYLCGKTTTPPDHKIKKASVDTWKWVQWEYASTAVEAISNLKSQISNIQIVSIEQNKKSIRYDKANYSLPIALIVGHESYGVSKETLAAADQIVEIPLFGVNKSLNVMVSCAIVLYELVKQRF